MRRIYKNTRYGLLFFERKISSQTSHKTRHFILTKAFEFPKDFSRKVLWSGFGADAPTDNEHKKRGHTAFFILSLCVETAVSGPCFKGLLKKSLENLQNFRTEYTTLFWQKLLGFQRTFREKSFALSPAAEAPTDNAHKKHGVAVLFYICLICF